MNHYLLNNLEFNNIHFYENTISVMVKKTKIILTKSDDGCCDIRIHLRDKRGLDEGKFKFYIFKNANNNSCKYTFSESFKYRNDENEPLLK